MTSFLTDLSTGPSLSGPRKSVFKKSDAQSLTEVPNINLNRKASYNIPNKSNSGFVSQKKKGRKRKGSRSKKKKGGNGSKKVMKNPEDTLFGADPTFEDEGLGFTLEELTGDTHFGGVEDVKIRLDSDSESNPELDMLRPKDDSGFDELNFYDDDMLSGMNDSTSIPPKTSKKSKKKSSNPKKKKKRKSSVKRKKKGGSSKVLSETNSSKFQSSSNKEMVDSRNDQFGKENSYTNQLDRETDRYLDDKPFTEPKKKKTKKKTKSLLDPTPSTTRKKKGFTYRKKPKEPSPPKREPEEESLPFEGVSMYDPETYGAEPSPNIHQRPSPRDSPGLPPRHPNPPTSKINKYTPPPGHQEQVDLGGESPMPFDSLDDESGIFERENWESDNSMGDLHDAPSYGAPSPVYQSPQVNQPIQSQTPVAVNNPPPPRQVQPQPPYGSMKNYYQPSHPPLQKGDSISSIDEFGGGSFSPVHSPNSTQPNPSQNVDFVPVRRNVNPNPPVEEPKEVVQTISKEALEPIQNQLEELFNMFKKSQEEKMKEEGTEVEWLEEKKNLLKTQEELQKELTDVRKSLMTLESQKSDIESVIRLELNREFESKMNEQRLDNESLKSKCQNYEDLLDSERLRIETQSKKELERLERTHELSLTRVREEFEDLRKYLSKQHDSEKRSLDQKFQSDLEKQKRVLEQEQLSKDRLGEKYEEFGVLVEQVGENSKKLDNALETMLGHHLKVMEKREVEFSEKEKWISELESEARNQKSSAAREKERLSTLIGRVEDRVEAMTRLLEQEREKMEKERMGYTVTKEEEKKKFEGRMELLFEEVRLLQKERAEMRMKEEMSFKKLHEEKKTIVKERAELATIREDLSLREDRLNNQITETERRFQSSRAELLMMEEKKKLLEKERLEVQKERDVLRGERENFKAHTADITELAREVQRQSEMVTKNKQDVLREKQEVKLMQEDVESLRLKCEYEKSKFEEREKQIQREQEKVKSERDRIREENQKLERGRLDLSQKKEKLKNLEEKLNEQLEILQTTRMKPNLDKKLSGKKSRRSRHVAKKVTKLTGLMTSESEEDEVDIRRRKMKKRRGRATRQLTRLVGEDTDETETDEEVILSELLSRSSRRKTVEKKMKLEKEIGFWLNAEEEDTVRTLTEQDQFLEAIKNTRRNESDESIPVMDSGEKGSSVTTTEKTDESEESADSDTIRKELSSFIGLDDVDPTIMESKLKK